MKISIEINPWFKHTGSLFMKIRNVILVVGLAVSTTNLFSQTNRLLLPFLDKESQSNVVVSVLEEQPCPMEFTNTLSNRNLFTSAEQQLIEDVFVKYKNVSTNSGPAGAVLADLYRTNYVFKAVNHTVNVESWVADFYYTNSNAHEQIKFGSGMQAIFRNAAGDGYNVSFTRTGSGTLLGFGERKHGLPNGVFARFEDMHAQGLSWDYKLADFTHCGLEEYRQYTNGMMLGKFLVWNPSNGDLIMEADFNEPYAFEKHRIDLQMLQTNSP